MIFDKKYNVEKENLYKEFDANNKCYHYCKFINGSKHVINYEQLDRNSKKKLLFENKKLLANPLLIQHLILQSQTIEELNKSSENNNYLKKLGYPVTSFEYLGKIEGTVSPKLDSFLEELLTRKNILVGIHRVGRNFNEQIMNDIFDNGLKMTGHFDGANTAEKSLSDNVSYYADNKKIKKELMYANGWNSSVGSILVNIPYEILKTKEDLFIQNGTDVRLNPKYIVGYVPLYENHHLEDIVFNQKYMEYSGDSIGGIKR